jgi:cytochrome c biogenesis protein CcmG/thiol:disulfide interchange protein DsbE
LPVAAETPNAPPSRRGLARRAVVVLLGGLALAIAAAVLRPDGGTTDYRPSGDPRPLPRRQLASVTAEEFGGIVVGLRGTPLVVNVWASWCAPCRAEMPLLDQAARRYGGRVTFLGLASRDSPGAAAAFLREVAVDYPSLFDASGEVRGALGVRAFPTTYFFDPAGALRATVLGGITEPRLAAQLEDLGV